MEGWQDHDCEKSSTAPVRTPMFVAHGAGSADDWWDYLAACVKAAYRWRGMWGYHGREGMVIVVDGVVDAWVYEVGYAERWEPGSLAINEAGASWTALGHNGVGGALMWLTNDPIRDAGMAV